MHSEFTRILAFGSLFSSSYKGSELCIDIHEAPRDSQIQSLISKIEFLPFSPEIISAGKEFAINKINELFLCAQLRLLDGQFKTHWKSTFLALRQKIHSLRLEVKEINIFIMTDLPPTNWSKTYLAELKKDTKSFKLYMMHENDDFVVPARHLLPRELTDLRASLLLPRVTLDPPRAPPPARRATSDPPTLPLAPCIALVLRTLPRIPRTLPLEVRILTLKESVRCEKKIRQFILLLIPNF